MSILTFDQFKESLLNKSVHCFPKKRNIHDQIRRTLRANVLVKGNLRSDSDLTSLYILTASAV